MGCLANGGRQGRAGASTLGGMPRRFLVQVAVLRPEGDVGDPFFPDWGRVNLKGYRRPHWFAQGRQRSCVEYLMARRKHDYLRGRLWWLVMSLERNPRFLTRARTSVHLWRRVRQRVGLYSAQLHTLIRSRVRPKVWASKVTSRSKLAARSAHQTRLLYEGVNGVMKNRWSIQQVPQKNIPFKLRALSDTLTASPDEQVYYQQLIDTFATVYPDRADKLTMADIEYFRRSPLMNYFQQLFDEYDLVHAYSTDPIYPLLLNRHPYIAFEHGTIRLIPFEETARGRLTSLAYYLADGVVITNSDNLLAAQKLKLHNYTFIPHPMNEIWNRVGIGAHVREALRRELNADFVVFHPARHYWSREPLEEQKANHLLIEGLARFIREVAPRAAAIFIDWGTSVDASKALLQSLGIQDHVQWIQPMNRANMARTMDACDVVADQFFLGAFGGIPPQALALGKPTLLKFSEAMHEWCFAEFPPLINVESADGIFEALKRLYTDRNWYEQVSQAGRSWYARYHSNNIIAAKTLTMYQEALQKSQQPN